MSPRSLKPKLQNRALAAKKQRFLAAVHNIDMSINTPSQLGLFAVLLEPIRLAPATTASANFSLRLKASGFHPQGKTSPGKNVVLRCTTAGFTSPEL